MTPLGKRLAAQIVAAGPISVSEYFARCLLDPVDGYYTTHQPFGADGDFVTAPEVSQMFGELVGVWMVAAWEACGRPATSVLVEVGPGRGTLFRDILRTLRQLAPDWLAGLELHLVEASPLLRAVQAETLGPLATRITWSDGLAGLKGEPLFLIANEFFDALPIRQFQKSEGRWQERVIGLDAGGGLTLMLGPATVDARSLPPGAADQPDGTVVEIAPARASAMETIAASIRRNGGGGLFFDYGHLQRGYGDTLQALRGHQSEPILQSPGEADLTAHVDFAVLVDVAVAQGLRPWATTQGEFLLRMGLLERAGSLGARADEATRERLRGEAERLAGPQAMGTLFKVLAVAGPNVSLPALEPFQSD